ncbi:hypothetical protein FF1_043607 [Malus domestica]
MASPPSSPQDDFILHLQSAPTLTQSQQTHPPNPVFLLPLLSPCWSHNETVSLLVTHWQDVTDVVARRCLAASQILRLLDFFFAAQDASTSSLL